MLWDGIEKDLEFLWAYDDMLSRNSWLSLVMSTLLSLRNDILELGTHLQIWPVPANFLTLWVWEVNGSFSEWQIFGINENNLEGMIIIWKEWQ
jgi:hypothetical protein